MAKATIKSKTGALITVEGTENEVSHVIAQFERLATIEHVKQTITETAMAKREQKKRLAASDIIIELKEEEFFNKPKSLTEIMQALEEKGRITPITSLSGLMVGFVQKRLLGRKKIDGKWVYGK